MEPAKIRPSSFSLLAIPALVLTLMGSSCSSKSGGTGNGTPGTANLDSLHFTVEEAPEWSGLFQRKSGWFGGDGIFAVTKDGNESPGAAKNSETVIWFSDTMLGEIVVDSLKPGYEMIHNSVSVLIDGIPDSAHIHFYWKNEANKNASVFTPATPATQKGDYYWMGDGFVNQQKNKDLYIFGYRIKNISDTVAFGFKEVGNTLVIVPAGGQAPYPDYRQIDIPFFAGKDTDSTGSFGAGIFVNTKEAGAANPDGYVYVYGVRGKKKSLMVARVEPAEIEDFTKWTFWDGQGWNDDPTKIVTITDRLSNELGVMQLKDGRYALVFQGDGLGKYVSLRLSHTPFGPFGNLINLYDCSKDVAESKNLFPYNAKVHPVLSSPDELLISYNVNSFDFFKDIKRYPNLYRPRFVRVKILP
ncbi:DUF4185 domain-containing protein [Flavitalea flava]